MKIQTINEAHIREILSSKEIPEELKAADYSIVILTQSWCGEWGSMKDYLPRLEKEAQLAGKDVLLSYVEYDLIESFETFRDTKEEVFRNPSVPFVLYYRNRVKVNESNYVSYYGFLDKLLK